jgi:hypothetical protein
MLTFHYACSLDRFYGFQLDSLLRAALTDLMSKSKLIIV